MGRSEDSNQERIALALADWRQGDCVLGEQWFLFRVNAASPLTAEAIAAAKEGADAADAEVRGLMIATQSCDIVRSCRDRPFVEVCALTQVDQDVLQQVKRGRRPRYAYIPGIADRGLVADLDRVMTLEKSVIEMWHRTPGCSTDEGRRSLARTLARKRARFAFPDDFINLVRPLQDRMQGKHRKQSAEGQALRGLREIRVRAAPCWDANKVDVFFWFISDHESGSDPRHWEKHLEKWISLVPAAERFTSVDGTVASLDDLTARDYVESDPLDLDHLSIDASRGDDDGGESRGA